MREGAQREIGLELAAQLRDEGLPHKTARRVVREGEVDRTVEELLDLFLVTFLGLRRASQDRNALVISHKLLLPLSQSGHEACRLGHRVALACLAGALTLLFLLFGGPHALSLIDVNNGRLVLLRNHENHGDEFLTGLLGIVVLSVNISRCEVKQPRLGLVDDSAHDHSLAGTLRSVHDEAPDPLGEALAH